nr:MAG TPA: hypothetical protein [Caudoviricetes sp.]
MVNSDCAMYGLFGLHKNEVCSGMNIKKQRRDKIERKQSKMSILFLR